MKPTLMILAAGIGSRYGGLKQIDGMGPNGEAIIEFSISDAIRAGFGKVVFIIRHDIEEEFRARVGSKIEGKIKVEYAFQELDTALDFLKTKPNRTKPWGTAHAMLAGKNNVHEPFAVINADDYYGQDSFQTIANFLKNDCSPTEMGMVGYQLSKTLSENGSVARGVCHESEGFLTDVVEHTKIERTAAGIFNTFEDGSTKFLPDSTVVSMNFWGFHPAIFEEIEKRWKPFVLANLEKPKAEFFIPLIVNDLIERGEGRCAVLPCDAQWFGVTYTDDKPVVQAALAGFTSEGVYAAPLW